MTTSDVVNTVLLTGVAVVAADKLFGKVKSSHGKNQKRLMNVTGKTSKVKKAVKRKTAKKPAVKKKR